MMGDDEGAARHRGDAYGGIAAAITTKGAIKGITKLRGGKVKVELEGGKSVEVPEWANDIGILRDIAKKKGNFGIGSTSAEKSNELGKAWVGDNYRVVSDGKTLVSQDGLRTYRPPSKKPNSPYTETGIQSNFEEFFINSKGDKIKIRNAHMDIINE